MKNTDDVVSCTHTITLNQYTLYKLHLKNTFPNYVRYHATIQPFLSTHNHPSKKNVETNLL